MNSARGHIDWLILLPVAALMLFSIAFVYSASATIAAMKFGSSESLFLKHTLRIGIGLAIIIGISKVDYHFWMKISKPLLIFSVFLLIGVLFTSPVNNVNRWINLGPISFQPSEFAKFAMVIHFAHMLAKKQNVIKDFKSGFLPFLIWTGIICYLVVLQPNFSTAIVIYIIGISMMFIGNTNLLHVLATGAVSLTGAVLYLISSTSYRLDRLAAYFGAETDGSIIHEVNYQLNQALIALGNGGFFGIGPGQSRQSHLFLPESYGDFIFAIIGEEYGFLGTIIILATFLLIFWRGMLVARKAPDIFGYFLAIGILITFAIYVFVNAGVNSGVLPTTGLPMPFISYGGTAVFFYAFAIGILLNISAQAGVYPKNEVNNSQIP